MSLRIRVKTALTCAALVTLTSSVAAADKPQQPPRVVILRAQAVQRLRDSARQGHSDSDVLDNIRQDADRALKTAPVTILDKSSIPPSGDKHDYMSLAPYWWPDPKSPNGLPYIRRDGERNPELKGFPDHKNFDTVISSSERLALAYYIFGDERYAAKAAELLHAWFIDPRTRMNPSLQYAQAVKGHNDGRGTGLIETRSIGRVCDAVALLAGSKAWSDSDQKAMQDWFSKFLVWMLTSANGKSEAAAGNNHGSFYDAQIAALALFTGRHELAHSVIENAEHKRIEAQIQPDGSMPRELARTKSFHYSVFNLTALFELARLGEHVGVDLYGFRTKDGRSIRAALDYLLPYADGSRKWPYKELEPITGRELVPLLVEAADHFHAPEYGALARKMDPEGARRSEALAGR